MSYKVASPKHVAFPRLVDIRGRRHVRRADWENFKRHLAGMPPRDDDPNAPEIFVPLKQCAAELGRTVRSIERWLAEDAAISDRAA